METLLDVIPNFINYNVIALLSIVLCTYWYFQRKTKYWESVGVNGPKPFPFFGNTELIRVPYFKLDKKWYDTFGRIYGYYEFANPVLAIGDPDVYKDILVKDFNKFSNRRNVTNLNGLLQDNISFLRDDSWKYVRSIIMPAFSNAKLKNMFPMVVESANKLKEQLNQVSNGSKSVDAITLYKNYIMDSMAKCAFSIDAKCFEGTENPFIKHSLRILEPPIWRIFVFSAVPRFILDKFGFTPFKPDTTDFFVRTIRHLMNERKNRDTNPKDSFQLLLNAKKPEDSEIGLSNMKAADNPKGLLNDNEIISNAIRLFAGGFDNTFTFLALCTYHLAINPEVQEKLYEEISKVKDLEDYESISKLPFLDAVVSETLRLHPVNSIIEREAEEDYYINEMGITIPRGTLVHIPITAIHYDPEFYPNPDAFEPQRFMGANRDNLKPNAYLPFGMGPRNCIATKIVMLQSKVALFHTLMSYRFFRNDKTQVPFEYTNNIVPIMRVKSIVLGVEKRE